MRKDLLALFSTNASSMDAYHVFVDRDNERESFTRAFLAHDRDLESRQCDPVDVTCPRRNVVSYFGVGGIGKTTLSRRLELWLTDRSYLHPPSWPSFHKSDRRIVTVRLNLAREVGLDLETMIIHLRAALARLDRPLPAFDVAFSRYWAATHPTEDLAHFLRRRSIAGRIASAVDLPEQLATTLSDLGLTVGGLSSPAAILAATGASLVRSLRDRASRRHALAACPRLADLLEADTDIDALSFYPYLLGWELFQWQATEPIRVVVFLDTFEDVGTRTDRRLERYVQRMVWLMSNVFFVITGRNRIDWGDLDIGGGLDWTGPVSWPGLEKGAVEEPRQHLVGGLSSKDAEEFLSSRLRHEGEALIPEPVRERIIANSHGLPLFLDLSIVRFMQYHALGVEPSPDEFDTRFPALVSRMFRDLSSDERVVLRAASLLDSFDLGLLTATAGLQNESAALRVVDRPFVHRDVDGQWPYFLHAAVREQIASADIGLDDTWSAADWARAARRALDAIGRDYESQSIAVDRRGLVACLNQGLMLAHRAGTLPSWLVDAAYRFVTDHVWELTLRPAVPGVEDPVATEYTSSAQALAVGLVSIADRQNVHRSETLQQLERCLASDQLTSDADDLVRYFHAECLRDLGFVVESERELRELVGPDRRMSDAALKGIAHLLRRSGRFRALKDELDRRPIAPVWLRLSGDLWWTQARFDLAQSHYGRARDSATAAGASGEAALSEACRAFAVSFTERAIAHDAISSARTLLKAVHITWADLHVDVAELVAAAGEPGLADRFDQLADAAKRAGLSSSVAYAELARGFDAAVRQDRRQVRRALKQLGAVVDRHQFGYLSEILTFIIPSNMPTEISAGADWIDGASETAARWRHAVTRRRRALQSSDDRT